MQNLGGGQTECIMGDSSFGILRPPIFHPKKIEGPPISPPTPPPPFPLQLKLWLVPINIQGWTLNLNWSDMKVKTKNWHCYLKLKSMFRTSVQSLCSTCHWLKGAMSPWEHAPWGYAKYFQLSKFYFSMLSVTSKHRQPKLCGSSLDFALRSAVKVGV